MISWTKLLYAVGFGVLTISSAVLADDERVYEYVRPIVESDLTIWPGDFTNDVSFQFEYRVVRTDGLLGSRELCWQIDNFDDLNLRLVSAAGIPCAIARGERVWLFDKSDKGVLGKHFTAGFTCLISNRAELVQVPTFRKGLPSVRVQIGDLIADLWQDRRPSTAVYRKESREASWRLMDSSRVDVGFTRERVPDQVPIKYIRYHFGDTVVELCNFAMTRQRRFPSTYQGRCAMDFPSLSPKGYELSEGKLLQDALLPLLGRGEDGGRQVDESGQVSRDVSIWVRTATVQRLSDERAARIRDWLTSITKDGKSLDYLYDELVSAAVEPIRIQKQRPLRVDEVRADNQRPPTYLAGHERWRVMERLTQIIDPFTLSHIRTVLGETSSSRKTDVDIRVRCLDLIGELGLTPAREDFNGWRARLTADSDYRIRAIHSTVMARLGTADYHDTMVLRAAVTDESLTDEIRFTCLEALLLLDETAGLDDVIRGAFVADTPDLAPISRRCLFAAGCSAEGRAALKDILIEGRSTDVTHDVLFLVGTSIGPGDLQWPECLSEVEQIALQRCEPSARKAMAAMIASRGATHRPFHDDFVRSVLRSNYLPYWLSVGWRYLQRDSGGERFCQEFENLLSSHDVEIRRKAAYAFSSSCSYDIRLQKVQDAAERIVPLMIEDKDFRVRQFALSFYGIRRRGDARVAADRWLPSLVEMARNEVDPFNFADVAGSIARLLGRSLPIDPFVDRSESPPRRLTREETAEVIREHRDEVQAALNSWAKAALIPISAMP